MSTEDTSPWLLGELWQQTPPEGEMFIWAYRWEGLWRTGLGYWTVTKGQWRDAYDWNGKHHERATWFHPMPGKPGQTGEFTRA